MRKVGIVLLANLIVAVFLMSGIVSAECPPAPGSFNCKPGDLCPFAGDDCHYDYKCSGDKCYERCLTCNKLVIDLVTYFKWGNPWNHMVVDDSKCCPEDQWCEEGECVPEASTSVLFAVGLLFLTGYIGLKRRKTK